MADSSDLAAVICRSNFSMRLIAWRWMNPPLSQPRLTRSHLNLDAKPLQTAIATAMKRCSPPRLANKSTVAANFSTSTRACAAAAWVK